MTKTTDAKVMRNSKYFFISTKNKKGRLISFLKGGCKLLMDIKKGFDTEPFL